MGTGRGAGWRVLPRLSLAVAICVFVIAPVAALAATRNFNDPADHSTADAQQQFDAVNPHRRDTPNDPGYDGAEPDDEDAVGNSNIYDEQFGLFGWPSLRSRDSAIYGDGPNAGKPQISGFNASGAWKLERGRPDAVVAILDTGIKWDRERLRTQIHLNQGELPTPNHARTTPLSDDGAVPGGSCANMASADDANGDGAFNVRDYVCDDRVEANDGPNGTPALDGQDLIVAFSDDTDGDANGFVDDIAGWDFFDNDNDPYDASSYFAASNHGSGRADNAAERGNDGDGGIGVCPGCQIMPIRIWDTFVSDGNTFAMGVLYGTDNGAAVIEGANGSTYHSAFAEAASQYAYDQGVVQTFSGDDLNTGNHNYPANYGHAMLIQGTVPDTVGLGTEEGNQLAQALQGLCTTPFPLTIGCPGTSVPPGTFFRGANTTQYGGKSSISMEGTTGSENTGKAAGAAALVISAARNANPAVELRPDETREILEQTAERVTTGNTVGLGNPDPGADPSRPSIDQWTTHFGWGRVNLGKAVSVAQSGEIPPEAAIDSPDWYAPVGGDSLPIGGLARARFAPSESFHWKLEWGAGETPASWHTVNEGNSSSTVTNFGSVNLDAVRAELASYTPPPDPGGPTFSPHSPNPFKNEFTVRLVVTNENIPTPGVDRRVFSSVKDDTLRNGFPKRMGAGGEAPIRYADVNGDNTQELIVPTEDGTIHVYKPDGSELPGWPVHTQVQTAAAGHETAPGFAALSSTPPREPPRGPVVADLDGDGQPEIVDTAGIHVYAWEPDGSPVAGFPVAGNPTFCDPAQESQPLVHPKCGFLSSPALARLEGPGHPLSIVIPSLDGHLYAFDHHGDPVPGFPVQLVDPAVPAEEQMIAESINEPAIGDLDGDGKDEIVAATNETYNPNPPSGDDIGGLLAQALTAALGNAAGGSTRVYAVHPDGTNHAGSPFLTGWPIKLNGAIQDTLPLVGPGHNPAILKLGGQTRIVASATGSTSIGVYRPDGSLDHSMQQGVYGPLSDATDRTGMVNLFESVSIGKLDPLSGPAITKYGLSLTDLSNLLLTGQNAPYNHLIGAWNAQTGAPLPAFPRITDDFQFLSASNVANVTSGPTNQVIAGTGLGLLHAYDGVTGLDAPGFPKVTGGWLFAPAALSDDGRIADITREGYLFEWNHPTLPFCQTEWPSFRHDPQQTGNYDKDGTAPYAPTDLAASGGQLTFKAPGDDGRCGTANHYEIVTSDSPIEPTNFASASPLASPPAPQTAGSPQGYTLPAHQRYVAIRAIDEAGNAGWSAQVDTAATGGGGGGDGGGDGGGGSGGGATQGGPGNAGGQGAAPDTRIIAAQISAHGAVFDFTGSGGQAPLSFECKLKKPRRPGHRRRKATFKDCESPRTYTHLRPGRHRFLVRAVDAAGQSDSTPASRRFRISR